LVAVGEAVGDGRTRQSGAPPDRHCSLSGAPPRHPTIRVRSWSTVGGFVLLRHRTVRCPSDFAALTSARYWAALFILSESTVGADSRCSAGSPDSPVNYSGACPRISESGWFGLVRPGAPDTVRWHTGQSDAPIFSTLKSFCSNKIVSQTWFFSLFALNLMHL
jgi:hypothetical protein